MPSKWPAKEVHLFAIVNLVSCITLAKRPCCGRLTIKPSHIIVRYSVLVQSVSFGTQPATMNAIFATIVANVRARFQEQIEVATNKLISRLILPFDGGLGQHLGWLDLALDRVELLNPCRRRGQRLHHGGGLHWIHVA